MVLLVSNGKSGMDHSVCDWNKSERASVRNLEDVRLTLYRNLMYNSTKEMISWKRRLT